MCRSAVHGPLYDRLFMNDSDTWLRYERSRNEDGKPDSHGAFAGWLEGELVLSLMLSPASLTASPSFWPGVRSSSCRSA